MIAYPYGETVTRVRPTGVDRFGDPVAGTPAETTFTARPVWPLDGNGSGGNEQNDARTTVISGYVIELPAGTDVRPTDQWRVYGDLFEQVGEAGRYRNPFTGTEVLTVTVKRASG